MAKILAPLFVVLSLLIVFPAAATPPKALSSGFQDPVDLEALPDGSLLVAQRGGTILRVFPEDSAAQPQLWADLGASTATGGESGLLGIATDKDFAATGYVYALQSFLADNDLTLRLLRLRDNGAGLVLNRVLATGLPSGNSRPGGVLAFGPDGKLYAGLGDGGADATAVSSASLRAVLLRLNPDGSIPADNPDPTSAVWATGLRDLRGLAWQPDSARLYALDRGAIIPKGTMDELNLIDKGKFYGWPKYLGRDKVTGVSAPVIYCSSGHSWIPGGALFVAGGEWKGSLIFAGAGEGVLYRLTFDPVKPEKITFYEELLGGQYGALIDVAQSPEGLLYLLSKNTLYRLTAD